MNKFMKGILFSSSIALGIMSILGSANNPTPPPSQQALSQARFGAPASRTDVEAYVRENYSFFDPYSAVIRCTEGEKGYVVLSSGEYIFGWLHACGYNAKNRMGAYVGEKFDYVFSKDTMINRVAFKSAHYINK